MGWDGAGNYTRLRNFSADASAGIKILASAMDQELNDFASAIGLCWTRNGQNVPTTDIPMGGRKFVNIGAPASVNNYMRPRDFIENVPIYMLDATTSTDNISVSAEYFTSVSAAQSPVGGTHVLIKMAAAKGSAPALHINTGDGNPHSANVVMNTGSAIYAGAMVSGGIYEFVFASAASVWHLMNPTGHKPANTSDAGIIEIATTAETGGNATNLAVTPAALTAVLADTSSFSMTLTGVSDSTSVFFTMTNVGKIYGLRCNGDMFGTSNSSACTITGVPAIHAKGVPSFVVPVFNNGVRQTAVGTMSSAGTITLHLIASASVGFEASGSKGLLAGTCMYWVGT